MILKNIDISIGGKAISQICKTVIFKNHSVSIGGRPNPEIAKTAIFTNWLLSNGGNAIFEVCKRSIDKKDYFPAGKVAPGHCLKCTPGVCGRDVEASGGGL